MWRCLRLGSLGRDAKMSCGVGESSLGNHTCDKGGRQDLAEGRLVHQVVVKEPVLCGDLELGSPLEGPTWGLLSPISNSLAMSCPWGRSTWSSYLLMGSNYFKLHNLKQQMCFYVLQICRSGTQTGLSGLTLRIYKSLKGMLGGTELAMGWCEGSAPTSCTRLSPRQG